jgi:tetratricopeptide (TPR) repeat protein
LSQAVALGVFVAAVAAPSASAPTLENLLAQYNRGEFQAAVKGLVELPVRLSVLSAKDGVRVDPLFLEWIAYAPKWIAAADTEEADRRRLVAASFALELARARTAVLWHMRYPFIAWACGMLRQTPVRLPAERWWHLAAIATFQENEDWPHVVGGLWTPLRATSYLRRSNQMFYGEADHAEATTGHLAHAKAAFPNEVRWRLIEAQYAESVTILEEALGPMGIGGHQTPLAYREALVRAAAGQKVPPPIGPMTRPAALEALNRIGRIPPLVEQLKSVSEVPSLRADAALRLGFLRIRLEEWDEALVHLRDVPTLTKEPAIAGLSHHFMGWVYQQTDQREASIGAYRRALALTPRARSTSILLAAQLLDSGRHADAYKLLNEALEARPSPGTFLSDTVDPPPDLWPLYPRGDAMLLPTYLTRLREALK